jgi:hypothetical protein
MLFPDVTVEVTPDEYNDVSVVKSKVYVAIWRNKAKCPATKYRLAAQRLHEPDAVFMLSRDYVNIKLSV